jgi:hypothetical protein
MAVSRKGTLELMLEDAPSLELELEPELMLADELDDGL